MIWGSKPAPDLSVRSTYTWACIVNHAGRVHFLLSGWFNWPLAQKLVPKSCGCRKVTDSLAPVQNPFLDHWRMNHDSQKPKRKWLQFGQLKPVHNLDNLEDRTVAWATYIWQQEVLSSLASLHLRRVIWWNYAMQNRWVLPLFGHLERKFSIAWSYNMCAEKNHVHLVQLGCNCPIGVYAEGDTGCLLNLFPFGSASGVLGEVFANVVDPYPSWLVKAYWRWLGSWLGGKTACPCCLMTLTAFTQAQISPAWEIR